MPRHARDAVLANTNRPPPPFGRCYLRPLASPNGLVERPLPSISAMPTRRRRQPNLVGSPSLDATPTTPHHTNRASRFLEGRQKAWLPLPMPGSPCTVPPSPGRDPAHLNL